MQKMLGTHSLHFMKLDAHVLYMTPMTCLIRLLAQPLQVLCTRRTYVWYAVMVQWGGASGAWADQFAKGESENIS